VSARVAIAVVTVGPKEVLAAALDSMRTDVDAGLAEVWVVDNGSTDGSGTLVAERYPWARLLVPDENLGYGRAVNLVAERSEAPWIAASNDDVELRRGALERLLAAGERHPRVGALAPRLELPDGSTQHSVHPFPTLGFTLAFNLGLYALSRRAADRRCLEGAWNPTVAREVPWAMAAFLPVRREAFAALGGFSSEQFMHAEDLDLGWRLARAGWSTWYEPAATVLHRGSVSTSIAYGERLRQHWVDATYAWLGRTRGPAVARTTAAINLAGAAVRAAALAPLAKARPERWGGRFAESRSWLVAHRAGLRRRDELLRRR